MKQNNVSLKRVLDHFKKQDALLYGLASQAKIPRLRASTDYFSDLCDHVISQQLSVKAGAAILFRFVSLFPDKVPTPEKLLEFSDQRLRDTGMSWSKVKYVKNLAEKVISKELKLSKIQNFSDQEVINELVKVKGIGIWTSKMFLMSTLGREDVFSYGDLGLRKAMQKLYSLSKQPTEKEAEEISSKWSPYKTYACKILWQSLEM